MQGPVWICAPAVLLSFRMITPGKSVCVHKNVYANAEMEHKVPTSILMWIF